MGWVRIDDGVYDHVKLRRVSKGARWLWVAGIAFANRQLTDGLLPKWALSSMDGTSREARELVAAGLWEKADDGWHIHDYGEYQSSRERVVSERAAARKRMAERRRNGIGSFTGSSPEQTENER